MEAKKIERQKRISLTIGRSLFIEIYLTFIALIIIIGICLCLFLYTDKQQSDVYSGMIDLNTCASEINFATIEIEKSFDIYLGSPNPENYSNYLKESMQLSNSITSMKLHNIKNQVILDYLRRIETFNDYQTGSFKKLKEYENGIEKYLEVQYFKTALRAHTIHSQAMMIENFNFTKKSYLEQINRINKLKDYVIIILITLIIIINLFFIRVIFIVFKNFIKIQSYVNSLSKREWNIENLKPSRYYELNNLSNSMNYLKEKLMEYIDQEKDRTRLQILLSEKKLENEQNSKLLIYAQLEALKAQVNPHFIFNSLNLIGKVFLLNNAQIAMKLIEDISKILRYSIYNKHTKVSFKQDLEIIKAYINIQSVRFQDSIKFRLNVDSTLKSIMIPPMLIQPIIENSFKHGFGEREILTIKLTAKKEEGFLVITIYDDGCGFDTDKILANSSKSIGLYNVEQRLILMYKDKKLMKIESKIDYYTKVELKIPLRED